MNKGSTKEPFFILKKNYFLFFFSHDIIVKIIKGGFENEKNLFIARSNRAFCD